MSPQEAALVSSGVSIDQLINAQDRQISARDQAKKELNSNVESLWDIEESIKPDSAEAIVTMLFEEEPTLSLTKSARSSIADLLTNSDISTESVLLAAESWT